MKTKSLLEKGIRTISNYKVGFDNDGKINAVDIDLNLDAGSSSDLTMAILERAMFHVDNAYYIPKPQSNWKYMEDKPTFKYCLQGIWRAARNGCY